MIYDIKIGATLTVYMFEIFGKLDIFPYSKFVEDGDTWYAFYSKIKRDPKET
jgi:hypothetical protein